MVGRAPVPFLTRYSRWKAVVTSNSTQYGAFGDGSGGFEDIAGIYVGTTGDVVVQGNDAVSATFKGVPAGTVLSISPFKITSGSDLVALYY